MINLINIYGDPLTVAQINQMRREIDGDFEDSIGFKVFMFTPIPGIDILAGLAAFAVEYGMKAEPRELLENVTRSMDDTDWSVTDATHQYTTKVIKLNRKLINVEAIALKKHIEIELGAKYAIGQVGKALGSFLNINNP